MKKIYYQKLSTWIDSTDVFIKLFANESHAFWLDSSLTNDASRFSYMGTPDEIITYSLTNNEITREKKLKTTKINQDIFSFLAKKLAQQTHDNKRLPFPFIGGYVGYFGYELKKLLGAKTKHTSAYPDSLWFWVKNFIVFDHQEKKVYLICNEKNKILVEKWFEETKKQLELARGVSGSTKKTMLKPVQHDIKFKLDRNNKQYLTDIETCKTYLEKGESYQICLTNHLRTKTSGDTLTLYLKLREKNPAPYAAYIKSNDLTILCSSPEEFLKIDATGKVETKPIKGTIRRGANPTEDQQHMHQLATSKKDWSENAMIVDLLRNDLGKVCKFGSVRTDKLMSIETYQTVHQLVSTIRGKLKKGKTVIDCVRACFPGGSMTGAPKIRTMEILDSLEKNARGIYSGSIGFLSFNQTAQLNIVIRTIVMQNNALSIGAGGAILIDSNPQNEYEEMLLKADVLMQTATSMYNRPMHTVFLGLGSNLGNKKHYITSAIKLLGEKITSIQTTKFQETKPMYYENQNNFLNAVIKGETDLTPQELFIFVKQLEEKIGRKKTFRNGPREIDIDILFYDDLIFESETLQIPHPRIQEREFVLKPLTEIAPNFIHPILNKQMNKLLSIQTKGWHGRKGSQSRATIRQMAEREHVGKETGTGPRQ